MKVRKLEEEKFQLEEEKVQLEEENAHLQDKLTISESKEDALEKELERCLAESRKCKSRLRQCYTKIQRLSGPSQIAGEMDPAKISEIIIRFLEESELSEEQVVEGFLSAICVKKSYEKFISQGIINMNLPQVSSHYKSIMYKELKWKFRPWICLRELDKVATVSFRGYEVIRRIEFNGEEAKYRQGLFYNRMELSRLSKELEEYGATILPYQLTSNAVKFDIQPAVKFILERYGLWGYVENKESVIAAATVDGGELAWKLTQISAGIKICDPRAVDPITGELLFGESGHENVQSRSLCFPLQIHIAKDNSAFYSTQLKGFFEDLNNMEDDYVNGLKFSQGADMCSLQKTVCRGK